MRHFNRVVVGFDHSEQACEAFRFACQLAGAEGEVRAVVALDGWMPRGLGERVFKPDEGKEDVDLDARVIDVTRQALAKLTDRPQIATIEILHVQPCRAILAAAGELNADLIVIGATGQGRISQWLLGSTASRLVRQSPLPVLVHHPKLQWPPQRILCPVDFSAASDAALELAVGLARQTDGLLSLLHVHRGPLWGASPAQQLQDTSDAEERASAALVAAHDTADLRWTCRGGSGLPDHAIVADAIAHGVDLLCMGTVGRSGIEGILVGNTAERVLRAMPCAIMTTRP